MKRSAMCALHQRIRRFWTAGMTWAERKFPDRWGRRQEDAQTPRVVVQIGVKDSDVQVNLATFGGEAPGPREPKAAND
jgi:hypothetical protein